MSLNTLIFDTFSYVLTYSHKNILSSYYLLCWTVMTQLDSDPANKIIVIDGPDKYDDDIIIIIIIKKVGPKLMNMKREKRRFSGNSRVEP